MCFPGCFVEKILAPIPSRMKSKIDDEGLCVCVFVCKNNNPNPYSIVKVVFFGEGRKEKVILGILEFNNFLTSAALHRE